MFDFANADPFVEMDLFAFVKTTTFDRGGSVHGAAATSFQDKIGCLDNGFQVMKDIIIVIVVIISIGWFDVLVSHVCKL